MVKGRQVAAVAGIAATLIGTVVGAGFASGQEVFRFFSRFGRAGWIGLILATALLGIASNQVFKIGLQLKINSYRDFLLFLLGRRLVPLADLFFSLFLFLLVGVMFAGSEVVFATWHLHRGSGFIFTGLILMIILFRGLSGVVKVNLCVVPLMFLFCLVVAGWTFGTSGVSPSLPTDSGWLVAALQFTAYNLVLAVPVLLALVQLYPDPAELRWGAWVGSIALGTLAGLIHWSLVTHHTALEQSALPMLTLAKQINTGVFCCYSLVLWGEMLTTLVANVYSLGRRLSMWSDWSFQKWVIVLCVLGITVANCGFVRLITFFYPIYGWISLGVLVLLLAKKT